MLIDMEYASDDFDDLSDLNELKAAIQRYVTRCGQAGGYMPAIATQLRIIADELADRFPDDTNGGRQ